MKNKLLLSIINKILLSLVIIYSLNYVYVTYSINTYCPVTIYYELGYKINVYQKLDSNNKPEYLEFRSNERNSILLGTDYKVFFRVFGAEHVQMEKYVVNKELKGVKFSVFKDSNSNEPDSVFVYDINKKHNYADVYVK